MTRITTPFGNRSTAAEVVAGIDLGGKRAIVTGAASGIGVETARALAGAGAEVTLAVRDTVAGRRVADDIQATTGNPRVHVAALELGDRAGIAAFAQSWSGPLHLLVNNAGVMALPEGKTAEGWDPQFAINHLGHFALTLGLRRALAQAGGARVVSVSSSAHQRSPVIFDDLHFAFRPYDAWAAYGQAKTANVLFSVEVTRRWADDGITSNALMPGAILTNLQRHTTAEEMRRLRGGVEIDPENLPPGWKNTEQGAATSVLLATSPLLEGIGGRYFVDCNEAETVAARTSDMSGVAPYALDPANAERLWATSLAMLGMAQG
ncbi:MAG TPA: SDR family NAD(P)-dependent oxidoreductase [Longimicrobium sp.]|jgi:NAD(P)-dependent dehydrogenase (short-subunit alcohol dehydrogenase family)|uniref:SDR family NAD(P)-dependent oxidoreductase n=1 Tax=Longimicrobium sp. TaxID=2029185 RepID=UPI002ED77F9C